MTNKNNTTSVKTSYLLVIIVLSLTTLMSSIDTNIVNIGLPTIARELNASFGSIQWIGLSYLLAVTSLIVGIGRIGDVFGKKSIFIYGIILFTAASLLCGMSTSIYMLIIFRALQGVGGAVLMALSFAIVGDLVSKEKLVTSMSVLTAMLPIGFALGPSIGGLLIGYLGWRAVFFFNVPIGIITLILVSRFPKIPISEKVQKFDILGLILLCFTLICYVLSVTFAESDGVGIQVILCVILTIVGIIAFLTLEHRIRYPLVKLSMFRNHVFSGSLIISVLMYAVITGTLLILPFYLQQARGFSTSKSGLLMTIGPVSCAIFTPISQWAAKKFGNYTIMLVGIFAFAAGSFVMATLNGYSSILRFAGTIILFNGSLAFFQTPNNAAIISTAKPEQRGLASGLLNLSRTIGQTTGMAFLGAIFYFFTNTKTVEKMKPANIVSGIDHALFIAGFVIVFAFIVGLITLLPKARSSALESKAS
ncbi:MAG: MFS transporter [Clostridium sp.]|uniref:MFS transporter n=1 Tax=Clostridium sp. TaxID=1506 RepID=UPI0039EC1780